MSRPEHEMAVWHPPAPTRRTFATLLAEVAGFASVILMLIAVLIVTGCAPQRLLTPAEQQAIAECRVLASMVGGYNMPNQMFNQEIAFRKCLTAKGVQ
jgi:hypothetical protein